MPHHPASLDGLKVHMGAISASMSPVVTCLPSFGYLRSPSPISMNIFLFGKHGLESLPSVR